MGTRQTTSLLIGEGPDAQAAAGQLVDAGIEVVRTPGAPLRVTGGPGRFEVVLDDRATAGGWRVDTVIIADSLGITAGFAHYGLVPGPGVKSLGQTACWIGRPKDQILEAAGIRHVVILHGLDRPAYPAVLRQVLDLAITLQGHWGVQTYVLTRHLKVAGHGLEALQRQAKSIGVIVFKFNNDKPRIDQDATGVEFAFNDSVSGQRFVLRPDLVVCDEALAPSLTTGKAAAVLQVDRGADGFAQADNVHRLAVATNRAGVFAIGGSRAVLDLAQQAADRSLAALASLQVLNGETPAATALIDRGHCVRCLTCYRLCPHRAVVLEPRPLILAQACAGCGICMAQCPAQAISLGGIGPEKMAEGLLGFAPAGQSCQLVVLGCRRSAELAWHLALDQGWQPPAGVRFAGLPCAGSLSLTMLFAAFNAGADGVLVLSCHEGNCYSQSGSRNGRDQVNSVAAFLPAIGLEPQRLHHFTLAANMERCLIEGVETFAATIRQIGPAPLRAASSQGTST